MSGNSILYSTSGEADTNDHDVAVKSIERGNDSSRMPSNDVLGSIHIFLNV